MLCERHNMAHMLDAPCLDMRAKSSYQPRAVRYGYRMH